MGKEMELIPECVIEALGGLTVIKICCRQDRKDNIAKRYKKSLWRNIRKY